MLKVFRRDSKKMKSDFEACRKRGIVGGCCSNQTK